MAHLLIITTLHVLHIHHGQMVWLKCKIVTLELIYVFFLQNIPLCIGPSKLLQHLSYVTFELMPQTFLRFTSTVINFYLITPKNRLISPKLIQLHQMIALILILTKIIHLNFFTLVKILHLTACFSCYTQA